MLPAFTAIIIALISGVTAAFIGHRLSATKEHVFFIRQKLETLYLSVERFHREYSAHTAVYIPLFNNVISYNEALDTQNMHLEKSSSEIRGYDSLEMLVELYFPQLRPQLNRMHDARALMQKVVEDHRAEYKVLGPTDKNWIKPLLSGLMEFDKATDDLKKAVAKTSQKFTSIRALGFQLH